MVKRLLAILAALFALGTSPAYATGNYVSLKDDNDVSTMDDANHAAKVNCITGCAAVPAATHTQCAALCSNLVAKGSAGTLYSFEVNADATLSGAAWYVLIFDATALPANGAVTPAKCYGQASGTAQMGGTFASGGVAHSTGITIGVSTTGCFTLTASVHSFIAAEIQ